MTIAIALHVLASVIWVGGMFFAYMCLRPVAAFLHEPPMRLTQWRQVFKYFFPWVWLCVIILLATGFWIIIYQYGGMNHVRLHIHLMLALGIAMILIFMFVFFLPYKKLINAVITENWQEGGAALNQIRQLIGTNLGIGLIVVAIATGGRYFAM